MQHGVFLLRLVSLFLFFSDGFLELGVAVYREIYRLGYVIGVMQDHVFVDVILGSVMDE